MLKTYMHLSYPYNLWSTICQVEISHEELPLGWEPALDYVLSKMTHALAKETLLLYFKKGATLENIGAKYGMTQAAVQQKINQTIKKISGPSLENYLRYGLEKGREMYTALRTDEALMASASVEHLNLSVRAMNCLGRAKIETIGQLKECSDEDLFRVRNLGENTLLEIKQALANFTGPQAADAATEPVDTVTCTMRDRLVADLRAARTEQIKNQKWASDDRIADYLLSRGWTLPSLQNANKRD